jgi:hypothetical protein
LIDFAFVIHFQHDDHHILLDAMLHAKINTFHFQLGMWDTQVLLPHVVCYHVSPFESLVVQSYLHLQTSLIDHIHEQKFATFIINVLLDAM